MLETKAIFLRKESSFDTKDCVIEKVIRLSGVEYDHFAADMFRDQDFIRENKDLMHYGSDGRLHCLLVVGEGRRDGTLVDSSGYDYARYSAFVPNAQALYAADRYPYLAERARQLVAAADFVVSLASEKWPEGTKVEDPFKYAIRFHTLSEKFGVSFDPYDSLTDIFMAMLSERPEIGLVRCNNEEFLIDAAPPEIALAVERESETDALDDIVQEFAAWKYQVNNSDGSWCEDQRYRKHKDGVLYYIGGESGQYMRISKDGKLTVGTYELASPGIEDAVLCSHACKPYDSYEQAFLAASRLVGQRLLTDIFHEKPSVLEQIREARKAPPAPKKQKDGRGKEEPGL